MIVRTRGLGTCTVTQGQPNGGAAVPTSYPASDVITLAQAQGLASELAPWIPNLVPIDQSTNPSFPLLYSSDCNGKVYGLETKLSANAVGNAPSWSLENAGAILSLISSPGKFVVQDGALTWNGNSLFQLPATNAGGQIVPGEAQAPAAPVQGIAAPAQAIPSGSAGATPAMNSNDGVVVSSGMDMNTMLLLGGVALIGLWMVMK